VVSTKDTQATTKPVLDKRSVIQAERIFVSQHTIVNEEKNTKFVFGWDQPLQSFYLQVHDLSKSEEEQIMMWLGTGDTVMYEVEELVRTAFVLGCDIPYETRVKLYAEKDDSV
jgi:hypothetical protein